jgi:hypothetical protein
MNLIFREANPEYGRLSTLANCGEAKQESPWQNQNTNTATGE